MASTKSRIKPRTWTGHRGQLAKRIAAGVGGWLQLQIASDLDQTIGEDAARHALVTLLHAQRRFDVEVNYRPKGWDTKHRLDIALVPRTATAKTVYGVIELKWLTGARDWGATRLDIVQDAVRTMAETTANLNAHFVVIGGHQQAFRSLFNTKHPRAKAKEARRAAFVRLFPRTYREMGSLTRAELDEHFAAAESRLPTGIQVLGKGKLQARCVAAASAKIHKREQGFVYVWQIGLTGR